MASSAFPRPAASVGGPLWKGPEEDGVTFSLLCRFLQCPERFRIYAVEGLRPRRGFNHRAEYGNMWHLCEECHATGRDWQIHLFDYSQKLCRQYPMEQEEIDKWYRVCAVQFPIYLDFWKGYEAKNGLLAVAREEVFDVRYVLPSGRTVRLRGKRDGVYAARGGLCLFETKTKGDMDESALQTQLTFDLQTMMYMVAAGVEGRTLSGVYYNVVRRPLSGGTGTIVRHKATAGAKCPKCKGEGRITAKVYDAKLGGPIQSCEKCRGRGRVGGKPEETWQSYLDRLRGIIDGTAVDAPGPKHFFVRWLVPVTDGDVRLFRTQCLDPLLERLCHWYDRQAGNSGKKGPVPPWCLHFRMPYGVNLPLLDGGSTEYDEYLRTGSAVGLDRVANLFEELT